MRKMKRVLSLILAMVMILSLGATPVQAAGRGQQGWSNVTYGADESKAEETAEPAEETSAEKEAEAPAEVPEAAAEEPEAPVDESEAPAEEPAAPADETEVPAEEPAAPAEPAVSYPAVTLAGATEGGVTVRVEAPEGALPEGAYMTLKDVSAEDVQAKVDEEIKGEILAAVDITFNDNADKEIQPTGNVSVFIKAPEFAESAAEDLGILHIDEENKVAEELTTEENAVEVNAAEKNEVSFSNDAFSIYAVIDGTHTNARLTINFWNMDNNDQEPVATVYVKQKDLTESGGKTAMEKLEQIICDPGIGTVYSTSDHKLFRGWNISTERGSVDGPHCTDGSEYTVADSEVKAKTIEEIRQYLIDNAADEIQENQELNIYAMIYKYWTVQYQDDNGIVLDTEDVVMMPDETKIENYEITMNYTPDIDTVEFTGWHVQDGTVSNAVYDGEPLDVTDVTTVYPVGTTLTIESNVTFSTNNAPGFWLIFDENGKNATYNAPVFVENGHYPREFKPEDPKRTGYTFLGWYLKDADGNQTENSFKNLWDTALTSTTTIYAKWQVKQTAEYTIIVWQQSVNDHKDAPDADKTYDYVFSTIAQADSNTPVSTSLNGLPVHRGYAGNDSVTIDGSTYSFKGFKLNTTQGIGGIKTNKMTVDETTGAVTDLGVVEPDDTTVVNIYYDRELVHYYFYLNTSVPTYTPVSAPRYGDGYYYVSNGDGTYSYEHLYGRASIESFFSGWGGSEVYRFSPVLGFFSPRWFTTRISLGYYTNPVTAYSLSYSGSWVRQDSMTLTGLYGQELSKYGYVWPETHRWFVSSDPNENTFTSVETTFHQVTSVTSLDSTFYGHDANYNAYVYHYLQNADGSWPEEATYTVATSARNGMTFKTFAGYTPDEYRVALPNNVTSYKVVTAVVGGSGSGENDDVDYVYRDNGASYDPQIENGIKWTEWLEPGVSVEFTSGYYVYGPISSADQIPASPAAGGIQMRYTRRSYPLNYAVGKFVNGRFEKQDDEDMSHKLPHSEPNIMFGSSLAEYGEGQTKYYDPGVPEGTGYIFAGWYEDKACTKKFDFANSVMPENGITVYGLWIEKQYRVFLHPNAGNDTGLNYGIPDESVALNFRVDYKGTVSLLTPTRTGYKFIGWYTDKKCTKLYSAATKLTDAAPTQPYDKTAEENLTDPMDKWGNLGANPYNSDLIGYDGNERTWVTRKLDLYARWAAVITGATGIGIKYDANGTDVDGNPIDGVITSAPTDARKYQDNISVVAQAASTPSDSTNYQFLYWVLQTYNGSEYVDKTYSDGSLCTYYPGEVFTLLMSDAKEETIDPSAEGYDSVNNYKTYTVQLRACYGPKEMPTDTHIEWFRNYGSDTPDAILQSKDGLQINEAIDIYPAVTRGGYKFLGWAKKNEYNNLDGNNELTPASVLQYKYDVTADDLFLKYVEAEGNAAAHYEAKDKNGAWTTVTQVAADEILPYEALYAVWELAMEYFYVFHSSTGELEAVELYDGNGDKVEYDFSDVDDGLLYGGTFSSYGGYTASEDDKSAVVTAGAGTRTNVTENTYNGSSLTVSNSNVKFWTKAKAIDTSAEDFQLEADKVYYVKEVPDTYLDNYTQYVYDDKSENKDITKLFFVTAVDDTNYKKVYFKITIATTAGYQAKVCNSFTFKVKESGAEVKMTAPEAFTDLDRGYLGYYDCTALMAQNAVIEIQPYWITLDNKPVYGKTRTLKLGDCTITGIQLG